MKSLTWRVSRRDGTFGDPVTFEVDDDTDAYLRERWEAVKRMRPSRDKDDRINELRVQLDLLALGARPVDTRPRRDRPIVPPPYLARVS